MVVLPTANNDGDATCEEEEQNHSCNMVGEPSPTSSDATSDGWTVPRYEVVVKVEGPFGASSQGFLDHSILVLVGAGIGVTPMISVLKQLLARPGKMKKTFFYWTMRDREAFEWFNSVLRDIFKQDHEHVFELQNFLTSSVSDGDDNDDVQDIGSVLLHHVANAHHTKTNYDMILQSTSQHHVQLGRPAWEQELASVKTASQDLGHKKCGIFLCGPDKMTKEVSDVSFGLSKKDPGFHFYFRKETF